jgi:quinol monooxygenase YgiN
MPEISTANNYLTLINVFKVDPANQQKLVELLTLATDGSVKNITGFISASLHKSIDGTKVTMYAQWRSVEDYQNMRNNPTASPYLEQALQIATFEPGMYEVVATFLPSLG